MLSDLAIGLCVVGQVSLVLTAHFQSKRMSILQERCDTQSRRADNMSLRITALEERERQMRTGEP